LAYRIVDVIGHLLGGLEGFHQVAIVRMRLGCVPEQILSNKTDRRGEELEGTPQANES